MIVLNIGAFIICLAVVFLIGFIIGKRKKVNKREF